MLRFCFLIGAIFLIVASAAAQGSNSRPTPVERRTEVLNQQARDYDVDNMGRDMKRGGANPEARHVQTVADQIRHDFEGLQERHNQLVLLMRDKDGLSREPEFVYRALVDIRKYAGRLKNNLVLPKVPDDRKKGSAERSSEVLTVLCKHIYDFIANPLFESTGVLDVEQGRKASSDLESIIQISEQLTKKPN